MDWKNHLGYISLEYGRPVVELVRESYLKKESYKKNQCGQLSAGDLCAKYDNSSCCSKINGQKIVALREILKDS